jgi:hypothetical protein
MRRRARPAKLLDALALELKVAEMGHALLVAQKRGLAQKLLAGEWRLDERFDPATCTSKTIAVGAA